MNKLTILRHADVAAGVAAGLLLFFFADATPIGAAIIGVAVYFAVNRFYPPARQ